MAKPTPEQVEQSLFDLWRLMHHPHGIDDEALSDRVRSQLIALGRDPDDWSDLTPSRGR